MTFLGTGPTDTVAWADALEQGRKRAIAAAAMWNDSEVAHAAMVTRMAPWVRPGVALALGRGGASQDAIAQAAWSEAAMQSQRPNDRLPGEPVRGAALSPGDRRLFEPMGRQREEAYFDAIEEHERGGTARREEAFLGMPPGQMREGVSPLDDLARKGLIRGSSLTAPTYIRGEMDPGELRERLIESTNEELAGDFMTALNLAAQTGEPVSFVDKDGNEAVYDPERDRIGPASLYTERPNWGPSDALALITRGVKDLVPPSVGEFLTTHGPPSVTDLPGLRDTSLITPGEQTVPATQKAELHRAGIGGGSYRQALQTTFMAMDSPVREYIGQIRNAYGAATGADVDWFEPQSDFLIKLGNPDLEPGDGLFVDPDSELAQRRMEIEAQRGSIYGEIITPGRIAAGALARVGVIEPGDQSYRVLSGIVDAGVQLADPFALAAGGVSKAGVARTLFTNVVDEDVIRTVAVSTPRIRGLASTLGVRGRAAMDRPALINALGAHANQLPNMSAQRLRGIAAGLNITGRTRMTKPELVTALTERFRTLDEVVETVPVQPDVAATPRLVAAARGGAAGALRATGVPQVAQRLGLIRGDFTLGVHGPTSTGFLNSRPGTRIVNALADMTSGAEIWRMTNNKLHPAEVIALRDATTPDEVRAVLRPMLGTRFRSTTEVWRDPTYFSTVSAHVDPVGAVAARANQAVRDRRFAADTPADVIDVRDPLDPVTQVEAWLRNAHASDDVVNTYMDRVMEAGTDYNAVADVVDEVMVATGGVLDKAGIASRSARETLTRAARKAHMEAEQFFIAQSTDQQSLFDAVQVGGKTRPTGTPFLWSSYTNRFIMLPDYREVRRLTSTMPNIGWTAEGKLRAPLSTVMYLQEEIWKPATLLRGAWPVRVIAEEQLRMAASGMASMWHDPLSFIAMAIARRSDATGTPHAIAEEYQRTVVQRSNGWLTERPGAVRTGRQVPIRKDTTQAYDVAWANVIVDLHNNAVARKVTESDNLDEVVDWLRNDPVGKAELDKLIASQPTYFSDNAAVTRYVENASYWLDWATGGNTDLLDAIRTGRLTRPSRVPGRGSLDIVNPDGMTASHTFRGRLANYRDAGPSEVLGNSDVLTQAGQQRNAVVERAFSWLMAKPTNYLSRSPAFRQFYWQRIEEIIPFVNREAHAEIIRNVEAASRARIGPLRFDLPGQTDRAAIGRIKAATPRGRLNVTEADAYAKGFALDRTRNLLYDMSQRSQIADSMRLIAPFGEAWKEVVTRWATLANPLTGRGLRNIRRFGQVMQGARGADFGEVMGAPVDLEGQQRGFFWTDEFGEEVFIYPGSQWLTSNVTDTFGAEVKVPLIGRVQGLSMFGTVLPGIGPVAALPTSWLLPDKPGWQRDARELLLPFGSITDESGASAISQLQNYAPAWMRAGFAALSGGGYDMETNRLYANTVMSVANYLYSTGRYDTSTTSGQALLLADAKGSARGLYAVRAFAAFGAPSAPSFDWLVETDEGLVRFAFLREEYDRLRDDPDIGFELADEEFLTRFGDSVGMTMQAHTREVIGGVEPTEEFGDWASANAALRRDLPAVWGFFGPKGGEFDYQTYVEQIYDGSREMLTPQEWLSLGQNHLGQMVRDRLLAMLGPEDNWSEEDRVFKRQVEEQIAREYPGFGDFMGTETRADFEENILPELAEAVEDERVLDTDAGQGLAAYWRARQSILDYAHEQWGPSATLGRQDLQGDRAWLFQVGETLVREHPDFQPLWDRHLRHEVEPDEEEG